MISACKRAAAGLSLALLAACGQNAAHDAAPPQHWQDLDVRVESRASPVNAGVDEFLVTITDSRGRPAYNLVVSLRMNDASEWKQAIEDGQMGVYRTGIKLEPNALVLQVQLRRQDQQGVLRFPLHAQP